MKPSPRSFQVFVLCALLLVTGVAGCDLFAQLFGQTADVPIVVQGSILLVMQNESGLSVDVDASFLVNGVNVRETRRTLAPTGPESIKSILRTTAERIEVVARVGAQGNAAQSIGTILKQAVYTLDVDFVDGASIYFVIPAPEPAAPNPNPGCNDLTPPGIACPQNVTLPCGSEIVPIVNPALAIATGDDDCDTDLNIASADEVKGDSCAMLIIRTWRATDNVGRSDSCQHGILLVDDVPPALTIPADAVVECGDDTSTATTGELIAVDDCNELLQQPIYVDHAPIGDCPKTFLRTWTATDACGNTANVNQAIMIVDTTPPQIDVCPGDDTLVADPGCSVAAPDLTGLVSATDTCTSLPTIEQSPAPGSPLPLGQTEIVFTVTDDCQNSTVCSMYVTVSSGDSDEDGVLDCSDQCPGYDDSIDCNNNGVPDACEIADCDGYAACSDCNDNGVPDECDITACVDDPACADCDGNGVPDGCEYYLADCNSNFVADECEIAQGLSYDLNDNDVPDECDLTGDFDGDGVLTGQDIAAFITCFFEGTAQGSCALADLDNDGDVDLDDLFLFALLFLTP